MEIEVTINGETRILEIEPNDKNREYLKAKKQKMGHILKHL